jgi:hypothetical protein
LVGKQAQSLLGATRTTSGRSTTMTGWARRDWM